MLHVLFVKDNKYLLEKGQDVAYIGVHSYELETNGNARN